MLWQTTGKHARRKIRWYHRWFWARFTGDDGMSTTEYAIGTIAAAALAGLLYSVLTGDSVAGELTGLVDHALTPDL